MMEKRKLEQIPFAMAFATKNGNMELCNATGYEVQFESLPGDWWNEYVDSDGEYHYGR